MKFTRENLLENIKRLVDMPNVKVVPSVPDDAVMVVTLVKDFDPSSNELWQLPINRSYPRKGIVCSDCKDPVVMSDGAHSAYLKNPQPARVICGKCLFKKVL